MAGNGTALFARYDHANSSRDMDPSKTDKYYDAGMAFPANRNIIWQLVSKCEDLADNTRHARPAESVYGRRPGFE